MIKLLAFFMMCVIFVSFSCSTKQDGIKSNQVDTTRIIEFGVNFLYKTRQFSPSFYSVPVKLVNSKFVPSDTRFMTNGRNCIVVQAPKRAGQRGFYQSETGNPEPFFEIYNLDFSKDGNFIELEISIPSVGSLYRLKIRRKQAEMFEVTQVLDSKI